jgi:hypothetical protein
VPCEDWLALDYQAGRGGGDVDLATVQAAMLELVVPVLPHRMNEHWSKVVEEFDLLDIPGMRAGREGSSDGLRSSAESVTEQMEIVKRGKVQYLFDRYIEERQVQTLLLLARGGNLEVRGQMKGYVTKWGRTRYGNAWPEGVSDDPPALFVGLTGIDEEFRNRSSYPGPELYDNRLRQLVDTLDRNLQDFGGQGRTFRNVFPLRYPGTWDTNAEQRETDDPQKWKHAGNSFVQSEWVRKYVAEPESRWEAAMRDGDGGLSLISRGLRSTTDCSAKQSDLERAIAETEETLRVLASSWLVPADANLERQRRAELARDFVDWLTQDRGKAFTRFHVVNQSLCLAEGDTLPIADFADLNWGLARLTSEPIEKRFAVHLRVFLDDWSASLAPSRWRQYCAQYESAGAPWLSLDQFHHLAAYLRDFLVTEPVFDSLCQRLMSVIQIRLRDEAACRQARRKYTRMILNDFILQPGPPDREVVTSNDPIEVEGESQFGSLLPVLQHWSHSLPTCLGQGAGEEVVVPAGNEALTELLEDWS